MQLTSEQKKETLLKMRRLLAIIHHLDTPENIKKASKERLNNHVNLLKQNGMDDKQITSEVILQN